MRRVLAALRREDGVAMVVATSSLLIISLLTAAVWITAGRVSRDTDRDRDAKRALAAAEAGLHVALYRLNQVRPGDGFCLGTTSGVAPVSGECTGQTGTLGNGAGYTYWVNPISFNTNPCTGAAVAPAQVQRCVTARGEVNGVHRRLQVLVKAVGRPPLGGMLGLDGLTFNQGAQIQGDLASNGLIDLRRDVVASNPGRLLIGLTAPDPAISAQGASHGGIFRQSANWTMEDVDWTNVLSQANAVPAATSGTITYTSSQRYLNMGASSVLTLTQPGIYNFCRLVMQQDAQIQLPSTGPVQIYIDSPLRSGSGCPAGTGMGTFVGGLGSRFVHGITPISSNNLSIYAYGSASTPAVDVDFNQGATFNGYIWAPRSRATFDQSGTVIGGVGARNVLFDANAVFSFDPNGGGGAGNYTRQGWTECKPVAPTSTDPESGC